MGTSVGVLVVGVCVGAGVVGSTDGEKVGALVGYLVGALVGALRRESAKLKKKYESLKKKGARRRESKK